MPVKQAQIVTVKKGSKPNLTHIKQFELKLEPKKKLDFIKDVFETISMT